MPDKELKLHDGTKEALARVLFCPICGSKGINIDDIRLYQTHPTSHTGEAYRKRRTIACTCKLCLYEGRGEVSFKIDQRF